MIPSPKVVTPSCVRCAETTNLILEDGPPVCRRCIDRAAAYAVEQAACMPEPTLPEWLRRLRGESS